MKQDDLPSFYRSNDGASVAAQRAHLRLTIIHLGALVIISLVSGLAFDPERYQLVVSIAVGVLMLFAIALAIALRLCRFDERWFRLRALAESAKSAAWQYCMRSPENNDSKKLDELLLAQIKELADRYPELAVHRAHHVAEGVEITERMRSVRELPLHERLAVFRAGRLDDQLGWYWRKAAYNSKQKSVWFWAMLLAEALALLAAAGQVWYPGFLNPVSGLSALAAAFIAWTNARRHSEVANSYAAAADDLSFAATRCESVSEEQDLMRLVEDVESACSREHRLWLVRRSV